MKKRTASQSPAFELKQKSLAYTTRSQPQRWVFVLTVILSLAFLAGGWLLNRGLSFTDDDIPSFRAKVSLVTHFTESEHYFGSEDQVTSREIFFQADMQSGSLKGERVKAVQYIDGMAALNPVEVQPGSSVLLTPMPASVESEADFAFVDYDRSRVIGGLLALFLLALLIFGRRQGFRTILTLVFTFLAIFFVFIPAILNERNIYLASVLICGFIVLMTLLLLNGANIKSACAVLGNIGGLALAGLLALLVNRLAVITGMVGDEVMYLLYIDDVPKLDLVAIVWSGMVIGALGAVMDVAMSVSSAMHELASSQPDLDERKLRKAGLRVGGDVLGTMTNTLILAYIGSSLMLVLVLMIYQPDKMLLINSERVAVEVLQALIGSLGILAAIPITSLVAARLYAAQHKKQQAGVR